MPIHRRVFIASSLTAGASAAFLPLIQASRAEDDLFELTAANNRQYLFDENAAASDLWSYNAETPGPEIRVRRGHKVRVRLINQLEEPTSVHWHGIRIANAMDGVAGLTQEAVKPGESFEYDFIAPDAGTYWYHAHNRSWNQVGRGLYGPLIVEEEVEAFDREHDLTLVLDDWRLDQTGALHLASFGSLTDWSHGGRLGNWLTVNGKSNPKFQLTAGEAYRFRLINAANSRVLEIDPSRFGAKILAFDGHALPEPVFLPYAPLLLGPAQRVDLLVRPENDFELEELSGDQSFAFANFTVSGSARASQNEVALAPNQLPEPDLHAALNVKLDMTGGAMGGGQPITYQGKVLTGEEFRTTGQVWAFNGTANLATEPLFSAKAGQSVVVETINNTAWVHAMHVHGHHFQIVERSGSTIDEGTLWRDTFLVGPQQTTKIAFVADNPGKWLLHCHMLEHAAAGMNTWFEVR